MSVLRTQQDSVTSYAYAFKLQHIILPKTARLVIFGRVLAGMDVVSRIERCGNRSGTPSQRVSITDCGILDEVPGETGGLAAEKKEQLGNGLFSKTLKDVNTDALPPKKPWYQVG